MWFCGRGPGARRDATGGKVWRPSTLRDASDAQGLIRSVMDGGELGWGGRGRVSPCSGERTTTKQRGGGDKWERKIKSEAVGTGAGGPHCRSQHARWLGRAWFVPRRWHHFSRPSTWSLQRRRCAPQIPLQALRLAMQTGRASYRLARSMATGGDPPSRTPSPLPRIRKRWRTVELGGRKWGVGCLVLSENEEGRE